MRETTPLPLRSSSGESRFLRCALGVLVLMTCLRVWLGPLSILERAEAQLPDPALQRKQVIEEAQRTNLLLSDIKRILETQTLNVRLQGADNPSDSAATPRRNGP